MTIDSNIIAKPFLRWAGSKKDLITQIEIYLPFSYSNYHEPFLGSGAFFFSLVRGKKCFLSDSNARLINAYIQVKDNVDDLILQLKQYRNNETFYYLIRNSSSKSLIEDAAQFIFLNRTCFNGLFRVNKKNQFNVPYGKRQNVDFVTEDLLRTVSDSLKNVGLNTYDFEETLINIERNDLVFIDPPYVVSHNENGFIEYNQKIFTWADQVRLRNYIKQIILKGAYFILTNAANKSIKELYAEIGKPHKMERLSKIGGRNAYRGNINEFLFTNTQNHN